MRRISMLVLALAAPCHPLAVLRPTGHRSLLRRAGASPRLCTAQEPVEKAVLRYLESTMESGFARFTDEGSRILNAPQRYSSKDWLTTLLWREDRVLKAVRFQFLSTVAWSLLVALVYIYYPKLPTLPALPHSLLGGVLSVLLGFRTNQSYQRFWEGRILWGKVFDRCRTTLRTALAYMDGDIDTYEAILRHLKAFPVALKQHLRGARHGFTREGGGSKNRPCTPMHSN